MMLLNILTLRVAHAVFASSLDAEKCFDRVWHDGLFFKLLTRLNLNHWLLLYDWYTHQKASVRWSGTQSDLFSITRGIRQGSLLSPVFFTFFIDDLLVELGKTDVGLRIDHLLLNNFAYADDVNIFASSVTGLQTLIDVCSDYSKKWRFVFGAVKTKCIIFGNHDLMSPSWTLGDTVVQIVDNVDILGVNFSADLNSSAHVQNRISSARRKAYSLLEYGLSYPGLDTEAKVCLWKASVCPVLLFGNSSLYINSNDMKLLESFQSSTIKRIFGFPLRFHHTKLLEALGVRKIHAQIYQSKLSLYNRLFKANSIAKDINIALLATFIKYGDVIDGTLLDTVLSGGFSPSQIALSRTAPRIPSVTSTSCNGVVDTLNTVLRSTHFNNRSSIQRRIAENILRAF